MCLCKPCRTTESALLQGKSMAKLKLYSKTPRPTVGNYSWKNTVTAVSTQCARQNSERAHLTALQLELCHQTSS